MPQLTLYRVDGSCAMVPHMLLRELQVPFTAVPMKVGTGGYEATDGSMSNFDFRKLNAPGYVPTLVVDDDFVITENPAIQRYIASFAPERHLMGANLQESIRVEEWICWLSGTLHAAGFGALWRPARYVDEREDMYPVITEKGRKVILQCFDRIESRIEGKFAVGGHFTVVDFYLHTFWRWGKVIGIDMSQYSKFTAVAKEVESLDSVRGVMADEQQPLNFS